jgi:penicillin-binding protein 2B
MNKNKNIKMINFFLIFVLFCFFVFLFVLSNMIFKDSYEGTNLKEFADSRSVVEKSISAKRGSIYDSKGDSLALNVSSYTLIAYLDESRSENESKLYHVKDKKATAKALSKVIKMSYDDILEILEQDLYQVEFGTAGKGLTELEKDAIKELNLPGIDFIEDEQRYYPNGNFLSYTLGYAKKDDNGNVTGEYGLELLLNDVLSGTDGYTTYQTDLNGYKIAGTKEKTKKAVDGNDVYLTVDSNIQFFVEEAITDSKDKYSFDWMAITLADAKTGKILALSQVPSYDPNKMNVSDWNNYNVSYAYEPGSVMKIYTYMAAMEAGTYKGDEKFKSGKYTTSDGTNIYDWLKSGFGNITYDEGFAYSSNVGIINLIDKHMNKTILADYFDKLGFGKKTGITLSNEATGKISFKYETEVFNAGFGQGITTTQMQHIQALTSIANDGVMLKPYIIDKVVDENNKVVFKGEKEELGTVASHKTVEKMKDLMYDVVHSSSSYATGTGYYLKGYDLIGKTGTAQYVNTKTGRYYSDDSHTIKSFAGMWPKDDPEVILFISVKDSLYGSSAPLYNTVKSVVKNVSKYLEIYDTAEDKTINNYEVENYINRDLSKVKQTLKKNNINYLVLGNGNKVINQYPEKGNVVNVNDTIILLTNDSEYKMPDLNGYSKKQVRAVCNLLNIKCTFKGYGYVSSQSVSKNTVIKKDTSVKFEFKN